MTDREMLEALYKDMQSMKQDMQGMKQSISGLENGLSGVKQEVSGIRQELSDVKTLATKTQIILENDVAKKINVLFEGHQLQNEKLDTINESIRDLESSVVANEIVTKKNLKEIIELKNKAQ